MPQDLLEAPRGVRSVILVVDDNAGLRESCRLSLEEEFEVPDAPDGPQGLEVLRRSQVDVVLLDIRLPGIDGLEVLGQIKAIGDQIEALRITAVKTVRTAGTAMKLGAFDYLTKPFDEGEVLALARRPLERRALQRARGPSHTAAGHGRGSWTSGCRCASSRRQPAGHRSTR